MAIRFACPSCSQPIEIDEEWGGESVGCPYCKHVVTAPKASTWPPGDVPVAAPAGPGFGPPPPPAGVAGDWPRRSASRSAAWALALAILCAAFSLAGWLGIYAVLMNRISEKLGDNFTDRQAVARAQRELMEEMQSEGLLPRSAFSTATATIGMLCGLGGVILGIHSLVRREPRKVMAVAACLICGCFMLCQSPLLMAGRLAPPMPAEVVETQPA